MLGMFEFGNGSRKYDKELISISQKWKTQNKFFKKYVLESLGNLL